MSLEVGLEDFSDNVTETLERVFLFRSMTTSRGIWLLVNDLKFSLPLNLFFQIGLIGFICIFTHITHSVLHRFSIPFEISQIIGGIMLGPSCLGRLKSLERFFFAPHSLKQLNNISLMLFGFLVGLKTDINMIAKAGKKTFSVAICSTFLPTSIVLLFGLLLKSQMPLRFKQSSLVANIATFLSMNSYTDVSCFLADLNLLTSKIGDFAKSVTLIAEFTNLFIAVIIESCLIGNCSGCVLLGMKKIVAFLGFMTFLIFVAKPLTIFAIRKTNPNERMSDDVWCVVVLSLVLGCGFVSDVIGYHPILGPFMWGLILPRGPFGEMMVDNLEKLLARVFLPVFLATAGLRTDLWTLGDRVGEWMSLFFYLMVGVLAKFVGVLLSSYYFRMPIRDCLTVTLVMISKRIYGIFVSCMWRDEHIIDTQLFTVIVLTIVIVGAGSAPLVKHIYRPRRLRGSSR